MTLRRRIGQAIVGRLEKSPRVREQHARTERLMPHLKAAEDLACSRVGDEEARLQLRAGVIGDEQAVLDAIEWLRLRRDEYVGDRAYRLLLAAATDTPVRPIDPQMADLFASERELGHLPLEEAFDRLAELEPELRALVAEVDDGAAAGPQAIDKRAHLLVGVGARGTAPLLRSDLAASIVRRYADACRRGNADLRVPYFADRRRQVHGGTLIGPARPSARN